MWCKCATCRSFQPRKAVVPLAGPHLGQAGFHHGLCPWFLAGLLLRRPFPVHHFLKCTLGMDSVHKGSQCLIQNLSDFLAELNRCQMFSNVTKSSHIYVAPERRKGRCEQLWEQVAEMPILFQWCFYVLSEQADYFMRLIKKSLISCVLHVVTRHSDIPHSLNTSPLLFQTCDIAMA